MNALTKLFSCLAIGVAAVGCSNSTKSITVTNQLDIDRFDEITAVDMASLNLPAGESFVIVNSEGNEVPYQLTYDNLLIFPATVAANSSADYTLRPGTPAPVDTLVYGRLFPERKDDMAWENDKSAYRAYGPALQASGERAFGYDIWTKSVETPILEHRYYEDRVNRVSFHVDHGNGMDVYAVGHTLGGGTAALLVDNDSIVYPYCFKEWEVLDNGPLRFTTRLVYNPLTVASDTNVVETRVISLDRGSHLNRTTVSYSGLSDKGRVAPGIVVHRQNPDGYSIDAENHYMAYADSTDNAANGNGVIFVGVMVPGEFDDMINKPLNAPVGDAVGHLLAPVEYTPDSPFTYYWGSGWSKGDVATMDEWEEELKSAYRKSQSPLKVTVK